MIRVPDLLVIIVDTLAYHWARERNTSVTDLLHMLSYDSTYPLRDSNRTHLGERVRPQTGQTATPCPMRRLEVIFVRSKVRTGCRVERFARVQAWCRGVSYAATRVSLVPHRHPQ